MHEGGRVQRLHPGILDHLALSALKGLADDLGADARRAAAALRGEDLLLGNPAHGLDAPELGRVILFDQKQQPALDRKSTRLNSSHQIISYAVFCLKKKKQTY